MIYQKSPQWRMENIDMPLGYYELGFVKLCNSDNPVFCYRIVCVSAVLVFYGAKRFGMEEIMKKKEIIIAGIAAVSAAAFIGHALHNEGALHAVGGGITEEQYSRVVGTPAPNDTIFDKNGDLTKEAEEKFTEEIVKRKSKVTVNINQKNIKEMNSMPEVKVTDGKNIQQKIDKKSVKKWCESILEKYGVKKKYDVQYETGEEDAENEPVSKENPYYFMIHNVDGEETTGGKRILLCKEYDDGERMSEQNYTKESILKEVEYIAEDCLKCFGGNYKIAPKDTWDIEEGSASLKNDKNDQYRVEGNAKNNFHYYGVQIYFSVAGYPVIGSAGVKDYDDGEKTWNDGCIDIAYGECGLQFLSVKVVHDYQVTEAKHTDIVSYKKALKQIKQTCETAGSYGGAQYFDLKRAKLGYVWNGKKSLLPVWIFYGVRTGDLMEEQENVIILLDAMSGEVLCTPIMQIW